MGVRKPDFAGSWYPGRESECIRAIEGFSSSAIPCPLESGDAIAGIVPHAGWYYSGQIAFSVLNCLRGSNSPDVFILFGRHLHPGSHNYIMKDGVWATPLGDLKIEQDIPEKLMSEFSFTVETASDHEPDNTIELQLPFIKYLFPDTKILPLGVPPASGSIRIGERTAEIAETLGLRILILGSTDLTHYGINYGNIPKGVGKEAVDWVKNENDKRIIHRMLDMDPEGVIKESLVNANACCSGAVAAAIAATRKIGGRMGKELIYRTSYDVRPDDSFVGYAGIVYYK